MSVLSEEGTNVDLVNSSTVVSVNRPEGSVWGVVILNLKFSLQGLKSSLKVDLLLDDIGKSEFDVSWKIVVPAHVSGWAVQSSVSQVVVLAWKHHLEELLEVKSLVAIAVEEANQVMKFTVEAVVHSIVPQKVRHFS